MKKVIVFLTLICLSSPAFAAVNHISFNDQLPHGRLLRNALQQQESGLRSLNDTIATIALMIDGDGSQVAHFSYVAAKFGFASVESAKAAWDELNSLASKLNTNASVSNVNAAMLQAFNKFR